MDGRSKIMMNQEKSVARAVSLPLCARSTLFALLLVAAMLLLASARVAVAQNDGLDATIQHLIEFVKQSDVQFERNFSSHDSLEAARHIEKKYQHFKDQIDTPEKFIELCATRSLVTGKQYQVVIADGEALPASEWLNLELARYRGGDVQP
jgi:hypothetical protein